MRRRWTALLVAGLVSITARREAGAQLPGKDAAYVALTSTPVGALVPMLAAPMTKGRNSFAGRVAHFASSGDAANSFGATFYRQMSTRFGLSGTLGHYSPSCTGCFGATLA